MKLKPRSMERSLIWSEIPSLWPTWEVRLGGYYCGADLSSGRYDGNILTGAGDSEQLVLIVGRYSFDKNPFIGVIADLSVWDR